MRHLAVLGSPIKHSKSPLIHRVAYDILELEWEYGRIECVAEDLEQVLAGLDSSWLGLSLTMPLKERAFEIAYDMDDVARQSHVVNTLVRHEQGWFGANTDVQGLEMALRHHACDLTHTVVLGAGATAVSAILAAQLEGAESIEVRARRPEARGALATHFGVTSAALDSEPQHHVTTVISTLPGSAGADIKLHRSLTQATLFDVAYDPWPSPLMVRWEEAGGTGLPGIDMLIYQAVLQIRLFVSGDLTRVLDHETDIIQAMRKAASRSMGE